MGAGTRVGAIKFGASGWLVVAGVLLPGVLSAADRHTDVHFALYGGYTIVAQGGVGRLKNLNFIIDTGAVPSVVGQRVARKLGLVGRAEQLSVFNRNLEAQRVVLPDLVLGPLRARSVDVLVTDLSAFERALGVPIAGMIGLDVLGSSDFSIDYATKTLSFGRLEMPASVGSVPFETGQGYVTVRFQVQERPVRRAARAVVGAR